MRGDEPNVDPGFRSGDEGVFDFLIDDEVRGHDIDIASGPLDKLEIDSLAYRLGVKRNIPKGLDES